MRDHADGNVTGKLTEINVIAIESRRHLNLHIPHVNRKTGLLH